MGRLAIKQLTSSDLTLFEWQFRNKNAGNQKSINLNANVFIDTLYPALLSTDVGRGGRIPLDMFLFGPGHTNAWNLQRKIIKGQSYKNWRLNGEYISDPEDDPERFHVLAPGDFAIFDFEGDLYPTIARIVLVAAKSKEDASLHAGIQDFGVTSMKALGLADLRLIAHTSGTPESHPVYELLMDAAIQDAAQNGIEGTKRLLSRSTGRRMTRIELERSRQRTDDIGRMGEELLDGFLSIEKESGNIKDYSWVSNENAISPSDFFLDVDEEDKRKVEVKSTTSDFDQILHISMSELLEASHCTEPYDIYRIYGLDEHTAKLRIARGIKAFAEKVVTTCDALPSGITIDGISVRPNSLGFDKEITIVLPANDLVDDES